MSGFALVVDDELDLVLREPWTDAAVAALIERNIERLRRWEQWAQGEPDPRAQAAFSAQSLRGWVEGTNVPTVMRYRGELVGTIGARIDTYTGVALLGYWIDAAREGHGIVGRSARALIDHLFARGDVFRVEIHTSTSNDRSRAVAERLGFALEGTLRSAHPVGAVRHDEAVYGLVR